MTQRNFVDWELANRTGRRLAKPGPSADAGEIRSLVSELRDVAAAAQEPVARTTRLTTPEGAPGALIVDRPAWIEANTASMAALLAPALERIRQVAAERLERKGADQARVMKSEARAEALGGRVAGAEVGALLAWLSTKVLGQYDLAPEGTPRLLLVAPNILAVERELQVSSHDFRLWVALHEETHRVQFTAVPWLRDHVVDRARMLTAELAPDPDSLGSRLDTVLTNLPAILRGQGNGLAELFATPEQRMEMARLVAVMSLLEGHADVVMDEVGPSVVPSVAEIRARFDERRRGAGAADRFLRRLLGLEAKMRQYRDGAVFVRHVVDAVGWDGFNRVFTSPNTLPSPEEILEPQRWLERFPRAWS